MMSRLSSTFARLKQEGKKALVIYLMAGVPDFEKRLNLSWLPKKLGLMLLN